MSKKLEPLFAGLFASIIIGLLSFLSFETSTGFWLMFSFGSTTLIVLVFYESEFAQPANIFFGHLLSIVIGTDIPFDLAQSRFIKAAFEVKLKVNKIMKVRSFFILNFVDYLLFNFFKLFFTNNAFI